MAKNDYKARIYENYYRTHIAPRKAATSLAQLEKKFKVFDLHFGFALPSDREAEICDAGCGNGSLVYWLQQRGYGNTIGVDGSPDQIAAGQALGIENLRVGNLVEYLEEHRACFDVVFLRDVLEHFDKGDVLSLLDICLQALRPNGRIVVQAPNGASPLVGRVLYGDFTHEYALTESSLSQLFLLVGFIDIAVKPYSPYFPKLSWKHFLRRDGRAVLARRLAWAFVRRFYALMLFAEIGRHNTVMTFNLIGTARRP